MSYTIKKLAELAGVSVRTLHYYDEIGLLEPSFIQKNGYRSYEKKELLKLQQILFFRELDFSLEEIKQILDSPDFMIIEALRDHKALIKLKQKRLEELVKTINKTINHMSKKQKIKDEELYDAFKDDDIKQYQEEAKQRWGATNAYKQSMTRVKKMTKVEMDKLKKDGELFTEKLTENMDKKVDDPEVQALIEQHYQGVCFFYDCSLEMYRNLGQMYVDDHRFTTYYDKHRLGLAVFVRDAINIYCDARKDKK